MRRFTIHAFFLSVSLALAFGAGSSPAPAQEADDGKLSAAVRQLADDISKYLLNDAGVGEVSLGSFTGAQADLAPNFGLAIKKSLSDELKRRNITVKSLGSKFSCKGEFTYFSDAGKVTIDAVLREGAFKRKTYSQDIFDVSDIVALMGGTGKLSTDPEKRSEDLAKAIENPQPVVEELPNESPKTRANLVTAQGGPVKGRALPAKDANYAMEIWRLRSDAVDNPNPTDEDYEPVPIETLDGGLLFANLELDNRYAVRLINNTDRLAAATLTIDGLNMFAFSTVAEYQRLGKVLVPPGPKGVLIKGWHHTNQQSFSFQVSDVGEAAVTELRGADLEVEEEIGVITARFAVAVDLNKGESLPPDEPQTASLGTRRGPVVGQTYSEMRVKIGLDREVISIRYSHPLPTP